MSTKVGGEMLSGAWWRRDRSLRGTTSRVLTACLLAAGFLVSPTLRSPAAAVEEPAAPIVHCGWVLASTGGATTFAYGPDDDTSTVRLAGTPCALTPEGAAFQPTGAPGLTKVIVDPNQDGSGREIEFWAAVSHPTSDAFGSGAGTVKWSVQGPDGSELAQVVPTGRSCAGTESPGPMWDAASANATGTGVFFAETVSNDEGTGLWQACRQGRVRMFVGRMTLASGAACGSYSVKTTATVAGKSSELGYKFDVLCPTSVTLDAVNIHWDVAPGGTAVVTGDQDPSTGAMPTVTNNGPNPVQIGLVFTPLRRGDAVVNDAIAEFAAVLAPPSSLRAGLPKIVAGETVWFSGPASVVCPGTSVRMNLAVRAPLDITPGQYEGSVRVLARAGGRC